MQKKSLVCLGLMLTLVGSLATAAETIEKNAEVAPGIFFSQLPVITDLACDGEAALLNYTVTNNIDVTVKVNQAIQVLPPEMSNKFAEIFISGGTCSPSLNPSFNLPAGQSCTIAVTVKPHCKASNKIKPGTIKQIRQALVLVPSTTVQRNTLTSIIEFELIKESNVAGLTAYIANDDDNNSVTLCPVGADGSLGTVNGCSTLNDDSFDNPIDVIVSAKGVFTGGVTMAYVANQATPRNTISVCPVYEDGTFATCTPFTDDTLDLLYTGLRLSTDNTTLYATNYQGETITGCPVNLDGTMNTACTAYPTDAQPFNGPIGRVVENLDFANNPYTYFANNYGLSSGYVAICTSQFASCTTDTNVFHFPIGMDRDVSGAYVFVVRGNESDTIASCQLSADGSALETCNTPYSDGDGTFDFGDQVVNVYMQNYNGYGYMPNQGNTTVSICPIDSATGNIGTQIDPDLACITADSSIGITQPVSVWIADLLPQLLYVGNNASGPEASIEVFSLPLTSISTPLAKVKGDLHSARGFAFDDFGNLFVADTLDNNIAIFTLPLTDSSTPSTTFTPSSAPRGITFDELGRLFVSMINGDIAVYNSTNTLAFTLNNGGQPYQMAFDSEGNLNVADCAGFIKVYQPPFFNNQTPNVTVNTPGGICVRGAVVTTRDSTEVLSVTTESARIYTYNLPLPSGAPINTITGPAPVWGYNIAADSYLNGYVPDFLHQRMDVFGVFSTAVTTSLPLGFQPGGVAVH